MIAVTRKVLLVLWMVVGLLGLVDHAAAQLPDAREKESQTLADGGHLRPVIESHGAVFDFDDQELVDADTIYKVVFDVFLTTEPGGMNPGINIAARFLNMLVAAGVPRENVQVAVVLHGPATRDAVSNKGHRARFGVDNPNIPLIEALAEAGVRTYVCAQSANGQGVIDDIEEPARVALSALTALVRLQADGYQRVSW